MPEIDPTQATATQEPAAAAPGEAKPTEAKKSLEDLLADLDDDRRGVILSEVSKARNEAKNLRTRLTEAEPKIAEYDRLAQASKTDAERALEAQQAAETRANAAVQRIAKAEVKAALAGLVDDPDSIIEDLNLSRFVDADGEIDTGALAALKSKYAAFSGRRAPRPDPTQASGSKGAAASSPASELAAILQGQLNRQ
jgi:murein DD-endopeptidase MepM/ murein hydrolase activator NlpD